MWVACRYRLDIVTHLIRVLEPPKGDNFLSFAFKANVRHTGLVAKKKDTSGDVPPVPKPRRKITLIEILVIVAVAAVIVRAIYHVVHWRDAVKAIVNLKPYEWAIALVFILIYYFLNRRNTEL